MKVVDALKNITDVIHPSASPPVVRTVIQFLASRFDFEAAESEMLLDDVEEGILQIAIKERSEWIRFHPETMDNEKPFVLFRLQENGAGWILSSRSNLIYSFISWLLDDDCHLDTDDLKDGRVFYPAFDWQRVSYDFFLTQESRIQKELNRETLIRELARLGFTHVEVNGLAFPKALETGPEGEAYPMFYTYCPALDQFVSSRLNQGLYPQDYLAAILAYLKDNARWVVDHGLTPGLLCFEPRSVPERFFEKYPMLRGARVDHPFRSFMPRYNMTIAHPLVREHYAEMMRKLMEAVPELGYLSEPEVMWV